MFTKRELELLNSGEIIDINGNRYGLCRYCNKVVRLNKSLFGSLHVCVTPEEKERKDRYGY